jgi:hypothetical protein
MFNGPLGIAGLRFARNDRAFLIINELKLSKNQPNPCYLRSIRSGCLLFFTSYFLFLIFLLLLLRPNSKNR